MKKAVASLMPAIKKALFSEAAARLSAQQPSPLLVGDCYRPETASENRAFVRSGGGQ